MQSLKENNNVLQMEKRKVNPRFINDLELNFNVSNEIKTNVKENERLSKHINIAVLQFLKNEWGIVSQEQKKKNDKAFLSSNSKIIGRYKTCIDDLLIILEDDHTEIELMFKYEYDKYKDLEKNGFKELLLIYNQLCKEGKQQLLERGSELLALGYFPGGKRSGQKTSHTNIKNDNTRGIICKIKDL